MKLKLSAIVYTIFCFLLLIGIQNVKAQNDPNTRDLLILAKWFEGEFDNDSQLWYEGRRSVKDKHDRMHTIHAKIDSSAIGDHVFYVEEYIDDDPKNISRQRIVSFTSLVPDEGIEMAIYFLKDAKKYVGAYKDTSVFKDFTKDDLFGLDGCNVIFQRDGEQYKGSMKEKACQFGEGKLKRYSVHDMVISKDQYWRVDRSFLVKDDSFYKGHPNEIPHKMRRAETYNCDVSFYVNSYAEPHPDDVKYKGIKIHNQGGMAWVVYPKNNKKYGFQLREKEYPFYGSGSDFFMMRFIEEGKKRSNMLVTAEPGTSKLSFNNGWASCFCQKIEKE